MSCNARAMFLVRSYAFFLLAHPTRCMGVRDSEQRMLAPLCALSRHVPAVPMRHTRLTSQSLRAVAQRGGVSKWSLEPADTSMADVLAWLQVRTVLRASWLGGCLA